MRWRSTVMALLHHSSSDGVTLASRAGVIDPTSRLPRHRDSRDCVNWRLATGDCPILWVDGAASPPADLLEQLWHFEGMLCWTWVPFRRTESTA